MARSIKLKNENYIDSTGVVHNKKTLNTYLNKSLICAKITGSHQTYNGSQNNVITFNTVESNINNGFTMTSNGNFKTNKDMSIKVSAYLNLASYSNNQIPIVRIFKNEDEIALFGITCPTSWANNPLYIANYFMDVQKGDVVTIRIHGNNSSVSVRTGSYCTLEEF